MKNHAQTLTLVTGATGTQGFATARALLASNHPVRLLVRNLDAPAARALESQGAELARGEFDDRASLMSALRGVNAVFSVLRPDADGTDSERRHGYALIEAARAAGARHFVHTSVCEAGRHTKFPRWESGYWYQKYWTDKWDVEEAVRGTGFERWTILKPAFLMDNFAEPKARIMFPHLRAGRIVTALRPQTRVQLIAGDDVGVYAAAAITAPARFDRRNIDLASEALSMSEVADILSRTLGKRVRAEPVSPEQARAAGLHPGWVRSQEWTNEVGYRADIEALRAEGLALTSFATWVERHASEIVIDV
jgi:uncharacterized protein YbjT (DUF2867 family)